MGIRHRVCDVLFIGLGRHTVGVFYRLLSRFNIVFYLLMWGKHCVNKSFTFIYRKSTCFRTQPIFEPFPIRLLCILIFMFLDAVLLRIIFDKVSRINTIFSVIEKHIPKLDKITIETLKILVLTKTCTQ